MNLLTNLRRKILSHPLLAVPGAVAVVATFTLLATGLPARAQLADQCVAAMTEREELSGQLDILSWNIQKASNTGWAEDLADLAGEVNLAFIQEASVQARIPDVIESPLYQAFAQGYTTGDNETGVMTLSSSSPSLSCQFTSWEPWLGTPKATSVTQFPLAGRADRLLAINLHAVNFALGLEDFRQQFGALIDVLAQHEGPVILAGDLNTWSKERQAMVDQFTALYGLSPVAFNPDLRTTAFGQPLDHIYVRGLHAVESKVVQVATSDHNPLLVKLAFN